MEQHNKPIQSSLQDIYPVPAADRGEDITMPHVSSSLSMSLSEAEKRGTLGGDKAAADPRHYNDVKMKYFRSLGMDNSASRERGKTSPAPPTLQQLQLPLHFDNEFPRAPISPSRRRSASTPININTQGIPIPGTRPNRAYLAPSVGTFGTLGTMIPRTPSFDSDDGVFGLDEDFQNGAVIYSTVEATATPPLTPDDACATPQFTPPHEMVRKNEDSFEVGTAKSLAVWENKQRRNQMVM